MSCNNSVVFQVHLHKNHSIYILACVPCPYLLLMDQVTWNSSVNRIHCESNCSLHTCLNHTSWQSFNKSLHSLYILKARTELWLPANLSRLWSESATLTALLDKASAPAHRAKRAIGLIVTAAVGFVAIAVSAAAASLALHESIQMADFVHRWHKDSHRLWQHQHEIDTRLEEKIMNLQHTVQWLGDQIQILTTQSFLRCDWYSS